MCSRGEILTCALTEPLLCTLQRQASLKSMSRPSCRCSRCRDPRELGTDIGTLVCAKCSGSVVGIDAASGPIENSRWKCLQCDELITLDEVSERITNVLNMFKLVKPPGMVSAVNVWFSDK